MIVERVENLEEFNSFVKEFRPNNIMQTSMWAKVKEDDWKAHYLFFKEEGKVVASALLLERNAFLNRSVFYCPRGFILDYNNEKTLKNVIELVRKYVKDNGGFVLKFDPELPLYIKDCRTLEILKDNTHIYNTICKYAKSAGLSKDMNSSFQPRFQMLVNLQDTDLKSKIKSKKRRLVNETYLEKRGFSIIEDTSEFGVKEFARLSKLTEIKQKVSLRNEDYFMKMYKSFKNDNEIKFYFAQVDLNKLIEFVKDDENEVAFIKDYILKNGSVIRTNGILCIYGTNIVQMFYGASDDLFSKYKAGYALHFKAMEIAAREKYDYFNLGGVQGSLDDGLFRFKSEFHPELFEYMGDFDIVIRKTINFIFVNGLKLIKKIRRR